MSERRPQIVETVFREINRDGGAIRREFDGIRYDYPERGGDESGSVSLFPAGFGRALRTTAEVSLSSGEVFDWVLGNSQAGIAMLVEEPHELLNRTLRLGEVVVTAGTDEA